MILLLLVNILQLLICNQLVRTATLMLLWLLILLWLLTNLVLFILMSIQKRSILLILIATFFTITHIIPLLIVPITKSWRLRLWYLLPILLLLAGSAKLVFVDYFLLPVNLIIAFTVIWVTVVPLSQVWTISGLMLLVYYFTSKFYKWHL